MRTPRGRMVTEKAYTHLGKNSPKAKGTSGILILMNSARASQLVKRLAKEQGFMACGISTAGFLEEEATGLENWLKHGFHGRCLDGTSF